MGARYDDLLEDYPTSLAASLASRRRWRTELAATNADLEFLVSEVDQWRPGSVVRVAFMGGHSGLHSQIAKAVEPISQVCNLSFDFGHDAVGQCRTWSLDDTSYQAEIRIGFGHPGYWSLVGTASIDPSVGAADAGVGGRPNQQSMNFNRFDLSLPTDWRRTVRHEFLHAVAFAHEHQNNRGPCQDEFRWEDDQCYVPTTDDAGRFVADTHGRRPGIYTYLSGPPNRWPRQKVDHNLRSGSEEGVAASEFDAESIMLYRFPPLFYRSHPSPCAPQGEGQDLSDGDKSGLRHLYPEDLETHLSAVVRAEAARSKMLEYSAAGDLESSSGTINGDDSIEQLANDRHFGASCFLLDQFLA